MDQNEFTSLALELHDTISFAAIMRHFSTWRKLFPNGTSDDAKAYLQTHCPKENAVSLRRLLQAYGDTTPHSVSMAEKWVSQQKSLVEQTICGPYLSPEVAATLKLFLDTAIPVRPEFDSFCLENGLEVTPAVYASFVSFARKDITKTNYHPFCSEKEYWLGSVTSLCELFQCWSASYMMNQPSPLPNYLSISEAAEILDIAGKQLFAWLQRHMASCMLYKGQLLLSATTVHQLRLDWENTTTVSSLLPVLLEKLPAGKRYGAKQFVLNALSPPPDWILPKGSFPQQDDSRYYTKDAKTATYHLLRIISQYPALPLRNLQETTGLNLTQLHSKVSNGIISATMVGDAYLVSLTEQQRIVSIREQYITLDTLIESLLHNHDSFVLSKQDDRNNLLDFLEYNDWWGIEFINGGEMPIHSGKFSLLLLRSEVEGIQEHLQLWLRGYKKTYAEQIAILLDAYKSKLPKTVAALRDYVKYLWEPKKPDVDMIDALLYWLPKELNQMSRKELNKCIIDKFARCTLSSCDALNRFLLQKQIIRSPYIFERTGIKIDVSSYSPEVYATMVAPIVNEQVIQDLNLIEKAIQKKKYADLWLYIALHMFAAIRSTDCTALSAPPLPCSPNEVLRQIQCGTFSEQEAYKLAFSFVHQVTALQMRPNKTKDTGLSADIYISCPESCMPAFGRIIAIASAHQIISQSSQLVQPVTDLHTIRSFFGSVFANACGNKDFSGRRANKALMQAVKTHAEESGHTPLLAYMLASRMRSHRGSYDSIAPTTAIYLRNSSFSNLTADDIAYLLMERGVCSFATDYMMQTCYGEKYTQLSAFSQTEAIRSIGCHVSHLDKAMRQVQYAMDDAIKTVNTVVQQKPMTDVLATLALGCAPGKEPGSMCMCKAADMQCQEPSRLNCLGCKYEVKTKALLVKYIIAYNEMWADIDGLLETDIQRKRWLANHIYAPTISEIQAHLLNAQTDMSVYNQLVLEVSENAGTKNHA